MKKILKIGGIVIALLVIIVVLAVTGVSFYLQTDGGQKMIRDRLNGAIAGEVLWNKAEISILRGRIGLSDVRVNGPDGQTIVDADRLFVNIGLSSILFGEIRIQDARFVRPRAQLMVDRDGNLNIAQAFSPTGPEKPPPPEEEGDGLALDVFLENMDLTDGQFEYIIAAQNPDQSPQSINLQQIAINVSNAALGDRSGKLNATIGGGTIDMAGINTDLRKFALRGTLQGGDLEPLSLEVETGGPDFTVTGVVFSLFEEPRMDLALDLAGNLAFVRDMINPEMAMSGPLRLKVDAAGALDNPVVSLDARYAGGELPGIEIAGIDLAARMEDLLVTIERLAVSTAPGTLNANGTIPMKKAFGGSLFAGAFDVNALSYNLAVDTAGLALDQLPWTGDLLAGNIGGNVSLEGTGVMPDQLQANASLDLTGKQVAVKDTLEPTDLTLSGDAVMSEGSVAVQPLALQTAESSVQVEGTYKLFENIMDLVLDLDSPNLAQIMSSLNIPVQSGATRLRIDASGPVMKPDATMEMQSKNLSYQDINVGDLALNARLSDSGQMIIDSLKINNQDSLIRAEGSIDLFDGSFADFNSAMPADMNATFEQVSISDFTTTIPIQGIIDGTARLTDTILNPRADLEVKAKDVVYQGQEYGKLTALLHLADGNLAIEQISLEKGKSKLGLSGLLEMMSNEPFPPRSPTYPDATIVPIASVTPVQQEQPGKGDGGSISTPRLDLKFEDSVIYAEEFTDAASGRLTIDGFIKGPVSDVSAITARLDIAGTNVSAQGFSIGDLIAQISMENGIIRLNPVLIENRESDLKVTGTVDPFTPNGGFEIRESPELDLDIAGEQIRLEDFVENLSGRLSIDGHVGGTLKDLDGNIDVSGSSIDLGAQKIKEIVISTRLDGQRIHIDPAVITLPADDQIRAEGWVSLEQKYNISIGSDPIDIRKIGVFRETQITGGELFLDFSGRGSFSNPQLMGAIRVEGLAFEERTAPDLVAEIAVENQIAEIDADLGFPLNARYNLETRDFNATTQMTQTDLDPYFKIAGLGNFSGQITANLEASGSASDIQNSRALLNIASLEISENQRQLIQVPDLSATFENGRYTVSKTRISLLRDGFLDISGNGRIDGDLDFQVDGMVPMSVAGAFVDILGDTRGSLELSADLGGNMNEPEFEALVDLNRIGMTVPVLEQELRDLTGRIRMTESRITIEEITGGLDKGEFSVNGQFDLENLQPVDGQMNIAAQRLPIEMPDMAEVVINTDLNFKGTPEESALTGTVTLLEGVYYQDVEFDLIGQAGAIGQRKRETQPGLETEPVEIPFLENLEFDIQIGYRNPFIVDNNIALMTITPELRFTGTLERPLLNGRAEVTEGTITFRNNEFIIEQGVIDFVNPYRIVPTIDIQAESEVRRWIIVLSISGTPEDLEFVLSSNPAEEDADIVSLLLTGKTTSELDGGVGGGGRSPQELLAGIIADRFAEDIGETTGLDIEFEYGQESNGRPGFSRNGDRPASILPEAEPGTAGGDVNGPGDTILVTVGKELSRRLSVQFGFERKSGEVVQQRTAIYKLLENLSVNAFQDTEGTFGGEMRWRLEFR